MWFHHCQEKLLMSICITMENHKVIGNRLDRLYHYLQIILLCHEDEYLQAKRKSENRKDQKKYHWNTVEALLFHKTFLHSCIIKFTVFCASVFSLIPSFFQTMRRLLCHLPENKVRKNIIWTKTFSICSNNSNV